jgi:4-hydroxy-tetrahydrodipicolinate synthase
LAPAGEMSPESKQLLASVLKDLELYQIH